MDLSVKVVFVFVVGILQLFISNVAAVDYIVGGEKGWTTHVDYRAWAKGKIFRVGDRLVFKYTAGDNNVVKVKRAAFKNCMADSTSQTLSSGNDEIELTTPGRKLYISSVGDHCTDGKQKLAITVFPAPGRYFNKKPYFKGWPYFPLPLVPAPAPAPTDDMSWIWKLMFPPTSAPAPTIDIPWTWMFPPSPAPAPTDDMSWIYKVMFPPTAAPAPTFDFPWTWMFPPSPAPAPAPTDDMSWWKWIFPPTAAPAPAPTIDFPWPWMFPPMSNAPSAMPPMT